MLSRWASRTPPGVRLVRISLDRPAKRARQTLRAATTMRVPAPMIE